MGGTNNGIIKDIIDVDCKLRACDIYFVNTGDKHPLYDAYYNELLYLKKRYKDMTGVESKPFPHMKRSYQIMKYMIKHNKHTNRFFNIVYYMIKHDLTFDNIEEYIEQQWKESQHTYDHFKFSGYINLPLKFFHNIIKCSDSDFNVIIPSPYMDYNDKIKHCYYKYKYENKHEYDKFTTLIDNYPLVNIIKSHNLYNYCSINVYKDNVTHENKIFLKIDIDKNHSCKKNFHDMCLWLYVFFKMFDYITYEEYNECKYNQNTILPYIENNTKLKNKQQQMIDDIVHGMTSAEKYIIKTLGNNVELMDKITKIRQILAMTE